MYSVKSTLKSNRFVRNNLLPQYLSIRDTLHFLKQTAKPLLWKVPMIRNKGIISIELEATGVGFFATLTQVLYLLVYCEKHKRIPHIRLTGANYINPAVGPNWFDYYFENRALCSIDNSLISSIYTYHVTNMDEIGICGYFFPTFTNLGTTLDNAHEIFFKYVQIKADIQADVQKFVSERFCDRHVLGVHYRGTDKSTEAPPVSWSSFHNALNDYLIAHPEVKTIFVASDDSFFIAQIKLHFSNIAVVTHEDEYRSDNGQAIHHISFKGDNYKKGRDALMNSLILSKCSALMRTSSALSAWASVFNPRIPVILLNRPYEKKLWFPETEVLKVASMVCMTSSWCDAPYNSD